MTDRMSVRERFLGMGLVLSALVALSGCAGPAGTTSALTRDEAASIYLAALCEANDANDANYAAFEDEDLDAITETAADARDASQAAVDKLGDDAGTWPEEVRDDLTLVRGSIAADAESFDEVAAAETYEEAAAVEFEDITASIEASQRIREELGLPADTYEGC